MYQSVAALALDAVTPVAKQAHGGISKQSYRAVKQHEPSVLGLAVKARMAGPAPAIIYVRTMKGVWRTTARARSPPVGKSSWIDERYDWSVSWLPPTSSM